MIATPAQLASATSSSALLDQALATATGLLLLTAVLQLWRKSLNGSIALLAIQGGALAALVAVVARLEGEPELALVAVLVFAIKAVAIPVAMRRTADRVHAAQPISRISGLRKMPPPVPVRPDSRPMAAPINGDAHSGTLTPTSARWSVFENARHAR